ncbi:MAG: hypothetical protein FWD41_02445 [Actinomycetia bacterium]|nr:hypothetical protein [Actinomycetes bacterium]
MIAIVLFFGASGLAYIIKKTFAFSMPLFCLILMFVLFVTAIFTDLTITYYAGLALAAAGALLTIFGVLLAPDRESYRSKIFSEGLIAFLFLVAFTYLINIGREVVWIDDFNYWALSVRAMFRLGDLVARHPGAIVFGIDKPPATSLFNYFFSRMSGGFSEFSLFASTQLLIYAFLLPLFDSVEKSVVKFFGLLVIIPCSIIAFQFAYLESSFSMLTIDLLIAYETGFGLFVIMHEEYSMRSRILIMALLGALLPLQKNTGIILVMVLLVALAAQAYFERRYKPVDEIWLDGIVTAAALLVPAISTYMLWMWVI